MRFLLLLSALFLGFIGNAQLSDGNGTGTIRGTIFDAENGESLIGVTVFVDGTTYGSTTDLDGKFSLKLPAGEYTIKLSYVSYKSVVIEDVKVKANDVLVLDKLQLSSDTQQLEELVITAEAVKSSENALLSMKKKSGASIDGISSSKISLTGDGTAGEAAKRVTGVTIEGGKYIYVRGLGDRYTKTTLNGTDIPGLDPDRNTIQLDIFPSNLMSNLTIQKNFTAELPADFTGGLLNIETKDFPSDQFFEVSLSTSYNPDMHLNPNFVSYEGGSTDLLGFDDGTRALPTRARAASVPTPLNSSGDGETVTNFIQSFNSTLGTSQKRSFVDLSAGISLGNQIDLNGKNGKSPKLGYIFSANYQRDFKYYNDVTYGEYQKYMDADRTDLRYATLTTGEQGEESVMVGLLGGLAFKTQTSKIRLTAMHLQNGVSRAGNYTILNDGQAVGQSGYLALSENLEYNERSLSNVLLHGKHSLQQDKWNIDWKLSATSSGSYDPDIRKTAFTYTVTDTFFSAGAGGNPSRIWRYLDETNYVGKLDITRKYERLGKDASFKFGVSQVYKARDYEILFYDIQFFGNQVWENPDPNEVLNPENLFPNNPNSIYYQSGNPFPNPNSYKANVNNTAAYISNESYIVDRLRGILGLRAERYVMRHTGRDQRYASGDTKNGKNLNNEEVLNSIDLFPTGILIYELTPEQNLRASFSRTIARPSFKELSFAQILDPLSNRIFNGSLFEYSGWDGNLVETRINNFDLRWEFFQEQGQLFSVSAFYKQFKDPIELVRIPEQQTSTEYQPRNVGDGQVAGVEAELRKKLDFISPKLSKFYLDMNATFVQSKIEMTEVEFQSRKAFEKEGESIDNIRQMAGQAPFVLNAGINYTDIDNGFDAGLYYNVKGRTLTIVGAGLFPDIYSEPFNSLNFGASKRFGEDQNLKLDVKVSNILNDRREVFYRGYEAEPEPFTVFSPGRAFGLGMSYRF